jgi:predicted transcriptional regulator
MGKGPSPSLIAFKALSLCDDLSATERRLLAALIEHFNRKTSRCDPSIDRLVVLLGINRRTIFRALKSLAAKGYVLRIRHGGPSHRNRYVPNWAFYATIVQRWKEQFEAASRSRCAPQMSPSPGPSSHLADGERVTQTCSHKLSDQTLSGTRRPAAPPRPVTRDAENPARNLYSTNGTTPRVLAPSSYDVARDCAERRWSLELQNLVAVDESLNAIVADKMTTELRLEATEAEFRHRGAGVALVLSRLNLHRSVSGSGQ